MEYESRRDADDAYHEMHNKPIGRDELLKIEVRTTRSHNPILQLLTFVLLSGLAPLPQPPGASIPVVTVTLGATEVNAVALLVAAAAPPRRPAAGTTRRAKTTVVTATTAAVTVTVIGIVNHVTATANDLAARMATVK